MKLILSDKPIILPETGSDVKIVDLSRLQIRPCIGCFGCWTKTPGKCVIRDDAVRVYPLIARSRKIIYVSKVRYGSYDTVMKTMLTTCAGACDSDPAGIYPSCSRGDSSCATSGQCEGCSHDRVW